MGQPRAGPSVPGGFFAHEQLHVTGGQCWQQIPISNGRLDSESKSHMHQGLERHGVGKWAEISAELLPRWDDQALRIKATRLLGSQSLARYIGWKGTRCSHVWQGDVTGTLLHQRGLRTASCSEETCAMRAASMCTWQCSAASGTLLISACHRLTELHPGRHMGGNNNMQAGQLAIG